MSWCDCPPAKCLGDRRDECRHVAMRAAGWIDPLDAVIIRDDLRALGVKVDRATAAFESRVAKQK